MDLHTASKAAAIAVALAISSMTPAQADESPVIVGPGSLSCGKFLEARRTGDRMSTDAFGYWIQGYLSGLNHARSLSTPRLEWAPLPDFETIAAYMDKYCRDHPLDIVLQGATDLFFDLQKKIR